VHVTTAEEAMTVLTAPGEGPLWPRLVLLDLNLPKTSGLELLRGLKLDPGLRRLPVVILTGSAQRDDVDEAYRLGAAGYIVKPFGTGRTAAMAARLLGYWQQLVLPPTPLRHLEGTGP
jgi:CheY-like chemotaxis protein